MAPGTAATAGKGPLSGFRILDLTSVVMGPYGTQMLADMGAEVILVEPPEGGVNRRMGPGAHPAFSDMSLNLLRGKRCAALDLKDPEAAQAALALARSCDAVVTNLRPKPLARLGLDYESLRRARPDIVLCQAQGFPSDGPRADDPAYDDVIQAETGVAAAARMVGGTPQLAPTIMADKICGMAIANAVVAALLQRERSGEGQRVEVPMVDVMSAFMLVEHSAGGFSGEGPAGYRRVLSPERGPQRTADGWINILPYSTAAYDALFAAGGREDMIGDPRTRTENLIASAPELYRELRPIIAARTTREWLDYCAEHRIPVGRIVSFDELLEGMPEGAHPQAGAYRRIPAAARFGGGRDDAEPAPAQLIGQETRAVLEEAGLDPARIEALFARGAARAPE